MRLLRKKLSTKRQPRARPEPTAAVRARKALPGGAPRRPALEALPVLDSPPDLQDSEAAQSAQNGSGVPLLQLYLREIGQVKLLTPQEEIALGKRIQKGDKRAREHMIKANLRLVVKIARDYEHLGLPLLDLINEGNMGLMKGVERFDPTKGAKLSTYASWWIKQAIRRALATQSKTIRLPEHVIDKVAHIRRAELKLNEALDRGPTDEELAAEVGLTPKKVREYRDASRSTVSLDAPLADEDESRHREELVADARVAAPFENLVKASDAALMREAFATLSPREQDILRLRFGLEDDSPLTLEEIGQRYRLTRERIRQIEGEGLKKLRTRMAKRDPFVGKEIVALAE